MLAVVIDSNDGDVVDFGVIEKKTFKFSGCDLEALVFDEFFDTVGNVEAAIFVLETDVTSRDVSTAC
jgi:hypothetical protein